ncbi:hypothetical protein PR202_gb18777 [Eleusine coracana subsp. coracana]|uniref:HMA domain-containing protein n=1 Tax=Eleusine coracana subsp. coracana TaxID=191504 RepID=A0AAV5F6I1_ELECO|nr:hypothetical protein PR202_gb18777 [Eleusine coracana subsp. coracana]
MATTTATFSLLRHHPPIPGGNPLSLQRLRPTHCRRSAPAPLPLPSASASSILPAHGAPAVNPPVPPQDPSASSAVEDAAAAEGAGAATVLLDVSGMMCGGCAARVRSILAAADARVETAAVNLLAESAAVRLRAPASPGAGEELAARLTECGFPTSARGGGSGRGGRGERAQVARDGGQERGAPGAEPRPRGVRVDARRALLRLARDPPTSTRSASISAMIYFLMGFRAFRQGSPNMNSLVGFGSAAAFAISTVSLMNPEWEWNSTFFDEPVMLLGFVLLGRSLEESARLKASSDMNELISLLSPQSRLVIASSSDDPSSDSSLNSDAITIEVPVDDVRVGDSILVLPGETIPVDGNVIGGSSFVDESNAHRRILACSQGQRASCICGNCELGWTFKDQGYMHRAVINDCQDSPHGAKRGLLIRGGDVLERLAGIDTLVLDKTGTLTEGKPVVTSIASLAYEETEILRLAAAVEKTALHPIANAIMNKAELLKLEIPMTSGQLTEPGFGCLAEVDGCLVAVGTLDWVHNRFETKASPSCKQECITAFLLSGDREEEAVASIGSTVGIKNENMKSSLTPQEKAGVISTLQGKDTELQW